MLHVTCYNLGWVEFSRSVFLQIKQFSAQLSHEPISFGGFGLYTIDFGLLKLMIVAIIAYMIISIQMTPD
jgi:7tm Chemosensory receptor